MNKALSILVIAFALALGACAKAPEADAGTASDPVFPASLKFEQPEGVR
jgi:starvation-inducible outer membrane lipoprotein